MPVRSIVLQWHITERCNLRCRHCYQGPLRVPELTFDHLLEILEQFKELIARLKNQVSPCPLHAHINVSGGEPFIREDFLDLLKVFAVNRKHFSFGILSNGTLIDKDMARLLAAHGPRQVQISIDGSPATNDAIRGHGVYNAAATALEHLGRENIKTVIAFTAHAANYREIATVARLGKEFRVNRVWADRLIPWGSGSNMSAQLLSPSQTSEFFEELYQARSKSRKRFCRTEISMGRALQFLVGGGRPYRCEAGHSLISVQANGDLYPCRRLPVRVGNVMQHSLTDLYTRSVLFETLRSHRTSTGCESCRFARRCRGGLRCLSYAQSGDPFRADPGCWHAQDQVHAQPAASAMTASPKTVSLKNREPRQND